ncbi:hypothetical protein AUTU_48520 (plasmid) [Aureibacter tunicatorum]|nr:hypothetical protein AUTU_48520 [Aureibacter tunicatorum]
MTAENFLEKTRLYQDSKAMEGASVVAAMPAKDEILEISSRISEVHTIRAQIKTLTKAQDQKKGGNKYFWQRWSSLSTEGMEDSLAEGATGYLHQPSRLETFEHSEGPKTKSTEQDYRTEYNKLIWRRWEALDELEKSIYQWSRTCRLTTDNFTFMNNLSIMEELLFEIENDRIEVVKYLSTLDRDLFDSANARSPEAYKNEIWKRQLSGKFLKGNSDDPQGIRANEIITTEVLKLLKTPGLDPWWRKIHDAYPNPNRSFIYLNFEEHKKSLHLDNPDLISMEGLGGNRLMKMNFPTNIEQQRFYSSTSTPGAKVTELSFYPTFAHICNMMELVYKKIRPSNPRLDKSVENTAREFWQLAEVPDFTQKALWRVPEEYVLVNSIPKPKNTIREETDGDEEPTFEPTTKVFKSRQGTLDEVMFAPTLYTARHNPKSKKASDHSKTRKVDADHLMKRHGSRGDWRRDALLSFGTFHLSHKSTIEEEPPNELVKKMERLDRCEKVHLGTQTSVFRLILKPGGQVLILKVMREGSFSSVAEKEHFAAEYLSIMDSPLVRSQQSYLLGRDSEEFGMLMDFAEALPEKTLINSLQAFRATDMPKLILFDEALGMPVHDMKHAEFVEEGITDMRKFHQGLGELAFYDMLTGNGDRILRGINSSNIFYCKEAKVLSAVDHTINFTGMYGFAQSLMKDTSLPNFDEVDELLKQPILNRVALKELCKATVKLYEELLIRELDAWLSDEPMKISKDYFRVFNHLYAGLYWEVTPENTVWFFEGFALGALNFHEKSDQLSKLEKLDTRRLGMEVYLFKEICLHMLAVVKPRINSIKAKLKSLGVNSENHGEELPTFSKFNASRPLSPPPV